MSQLCQGSPQELPSDQTLRFYLLREKAFNEPMVDGFIRDFRSSVSFSGIDKPVPPGVGSRIDAAVVSSDDGLKKAPEPDVGDLIQWEASGVLRLESPRRVRAKTEHEGSWWVFVEGSETGIPMDEAVVIERSAPETTAKQPPTLPLIPTRRSEQPVAGEVEASSGRIGEGVTFRLLVTGKLKSKQIARLIKLLEAQREFMEEDEEEL